MTTPRRIVRRLARTAGDAALWAGAACGVLCALLAGLGAVAGFGVVLFRTGSMSPTIPAGSAALVREIPADQIEVGDVVTVDRAGLLPVTHRVVEVAPSAAGGSDARDLTLRGDANTADDPEPYTVTSARRVVASVPGVAAAVAALGEPRVLIPVSLAVSTLITVMLWPRRRAAGRPETAAAAGPAPLTVPDPAPETRAGARTASAVTLVLLAGGLLGAHPAVASAATDPDADGPLLVIDSVLTHESRLLSPGAERDWLLTLSTAGLDSGEITREIAVTSSAGSPITVQVDLCSSFDGDSDCADAVRLAGPSSPEDGTTVIDLPAQDALTIERLRVRVALPTDTGTEAQGMTVSMELTATGEGVETTVVPPEPEDPTSPADDGQGTPDDGTATADGTGTTTPGAAPTSSGVLAITGGGLWTPLLVGLALLVVGTAHLIARRTRRQR
ncbi:MAG TPA: hypothetical protein VGC67_14635 [Cellulomonas sp.]